MEYLILTITGIITHLFLLAMMKMNNSGKIGGTGEQSGSKESGESRTVSQESEREKEINDLDLELRRQMQAGLIDVNKASLALAGKMLTGGELPGYLQTLPGGLSEDVISDLTKKSINDVRTTMQSQGILDSGTTASLATKAAGDIRTEAEEYNLNNLLQLLQLAISGSTNLQSGTLTSSQTLSNRLAGLRSTQTNTTGEKSAWKYGQNAEVDLTTL